MTIPTIHVGCGGYALGRLHALVNCKGLEPVAGVDINLEEARKNVANMDGDVPSGLAERIYTTITEAREKHHAKACVIFTSTPSHAKLTIESLNLGLHTLCVKPIAFNQAEFGQVMSTHRANPNVMLVQGQNKRWNPAAAKMREWLGEEVIGEMLGGECRLWVRMRDSTPADDEMFFHFCAGHQLDQLVAAKGLPKYLTAYIQPNKEQTGVSGPSGGQILMEYANGAPFCYTATRTGHTDGVANGATGLYGWSGAWTIHGATGDISRTAGYPEPGHLRLFRRGECVEDLQLQDLHPPPKGVSYRHWEEDDRLQFEAFAEAISTGKDEDWIQETTLNAWVLMEACHVSVRTRERVDVETFRAKVMGE